jgi:hypothetical protein
MFVESAMQFRLPSCSLGGDLFFDVGVTESFVHVFVLSQASIRCSSRRDSSLPLGLSPLLVSTQQLVGNLWHLHVLNSSGDIAFFLVKDLLDNG